MNPSLLTFCRHWSSCQKFRITPTKSINNIPVSRRHISVQRLLTAFVLEVYNISIGWQNNSFACIYLFWPSRRPFVNSLKTRIRIWFCSNFLSLGTTSQLRLSRPEIMRSSERCDSLIGASSLFSISVWWIIISHAEYINISLQA